MKTKISIIISWVLVGFFYLSMLEDLVVSIIIKIQSDTVSWQHFVVLAVIFLIPTLLIYFFKKQFKKLGWALIIFYIIFPAILVLDKILNPASCGNPNITITNFFVGWMAFAIVLLVPGILFIRSK